MTTQRSSAWQVGLTGGIGSGKSTVAAMLEACGAAVVDADQISRQLTAANGAALPAIAQAFGPSLIAADGALDRARMRGLIFRQPQARQQLEAIIHPLVGQETARQAQAAMAQGRRMVVYDIPLLVESGRWRRQLDAVIVVDCREQTQIDRVVARNQLSPDAVRGIMAAQASRSQRRACADVVLFNDAIPLPRLQAQVSLVARRFGL
ncbi:MAG: dephospho-CoA kinase [Burkholderiales bacterium]|nr:dephospho-CoA kinase [Burkholderiales bacterium]